MTDDEYKILCDARDRMKKRHRWTGYKPGIEKCKKCGAKIELIFRDGKLFDKIYYQPGRGVIGIFRKPMPECEGN